MALHIQHPDKPDRTRCGRPIKKGGNLAVLGYGPFGTCKSCQHHYEQDMKKGGGVQ